MSLQNFTYSKYCFVPHIGYALRAKVLTLFLVCQPLNEHIKYKLISNVKQGQFKVQAQTIDIQLPREAIYLVA